MRSLALVLLLAVVAAPIALAQDAKKERPATWKIRLDRPGPDSAVALQTMPPGWHVTTGPAAILYDPAWTAKGAFGVTAKIHLFPGHRPEGYGVFLGGKDLDGTGQSYLYFLLRKDGRYLVKHRAGAETHTIVPWTEHAAVVKHEGEGTVTNVIQVDAGAQEVVFSVNGQRVTALPRAQAAVDGQVGLRVNHGLDLHVTEVTVTPKR